MISKIFFNFWLDHTFMLALVTEFNWRSNVLMFSLKFPMKIIISSRCFNLSTLLNFHMNLSSADRASNGLSASSYFLNTLSSVSLKSCNVKFYGFLMVFWWLSDGFLKVFLQVFWWFSAGLSDGFLLVFCWFSEGFLQVFWWFSEGFNFFSGKFCHNDDVCTPF